mmetsp:Transcript_103458/g.301855  ORF Transcript_103458/g.301855 Transcript_103458/m.301855 type:complete len:312 (-) Transcript_103458:354-1289(-)
MSCTAPLRLLTAFSYFWRLLTRAFPLVRFRWRTRPRFCRIFLLVARLPSRTSSGLNCWARMACFRASSAASFRAFRAEAWALALETSSSSSSSSGFSPLPAVAASTSSTSACDSLIRCRGFSGTASTLRSALTVFSLAARAPSCCFTERICSASVLWGFQPPTSGSDSARSDGASAAPPSLPRLPGRRSRSEVESPALRWGFAAGLASSAGSSFSSGCISRNRSRRESFFAGGGGGSCFAGPAADASALLGAASSSRPLFFSFFQSFSAFATAGARRSSSWPSWPCSSRSQTSWEITGCERTAPPSDRTRM